MLNLDLRKDWNTIPMPTRKGYYVMTSRTSGIKTKDVIIIASISSKDFDKLQNDEPIDLKFTNDCRNDKFNKVEFHIEPDDVYCYGDIDFNEDSEDFETLDGFNWLNDKLNGIHMPIDYDYATHTCLSPTSKYRTNECRSCAKMTQYAHAAIGKPKYVCIFKETKVV